jgi:hypothetical protein
MGEDIGAIVRELGMARGTVRRSVRADNVEGLVTTVRIGSSPSVQPQLSTVVDMQLTRTHQLNGGRRWTACPQVECCCTVRTAE